MQAKRFAVGYHVLTTKYSDGLPEDIVSLRDRLKFYQEQLSRWGLKDYQITNLEQVMSVTKILYTLAHALFILSLASIPSLILNAPVGLAASWWAHKQAKKDLKVLYVHCIRLFYALIDNIDNHVNYTLLMFAIIAVTSCTAICEPGFQASRVKIAARDVMLSKMIVFSIAAVPALWFIYTLLLIFFAPLRFKTVILVALCFPVSLCVFR
jgi:glycerol-3-phosphate O-acyltransferase/dihydroxyacetone phosphate acyltransferase